MSLSQPTTMQCYFHEAKLATPWNLLQTLVLLHVRFTCSCCERVLSAIVNLSNIDRSQLHYELRDICVVYKDMCLSKWDYFLIALNYGNNNITKSIKFEATSYIMISLGFQPSIKEIHEKWLIPLVPAPPPSINFSDRTKLEYAQMFTPY